MESWYLPITIIPGLGLLILSTSNLMVTLSNEISHLVDKDTDISILNRKLRQLKRINMSLVFFYLAASLLLISAIISGVSHIDTLATYISISAIIFALVGLFILIAYSFKAVSIRQDQFKNKIK